MIGPHLQESPRDWPIAVARLQGNAMNKILFAVERARESKSVNAGVKTWYRWVGDQPLPYDNFEQHCRDWLNQFIDGTFRREAEHVDYIQGYNETLANSQPKEERDRWIALHTAMAKVWYEEYRQSPELEHIRIILCETAIGNDIPWQIAQAAQRYDAILGWHPYISCRLGVASSKRMSAITELGGHIMVKHDAPRARFHTGGIYRMRESLVDTYGAMSATRSPESTLVLTPDFVSPHDWRWYSGRWATMDAEYKARGITVDWAFGEGGPVLDASTDWSGWLDPLGGWRNKKCLNGDLNKYKQVLDYWLQNTFQTPAYQEGRLLGLQLFTSGAPGGYSGQWGNFNLEGNDLQEIMAFSGAYNYPPVGSKPPVKPPDPPIIPPIIPPTFDGLINGSFEDGWTDQSTTAQEPHGWVLKIDDAGEVRGRPINGMPECVHKLAEQLPPDEQPGGENALILDGTTCYKMFTTATWRAILWQVVGGFTPGAKVVLTVPVNIHFDGRGDTYDEDDTLLEVCINSEVAKLWMTKERSRQWQYIKIRTTADEDGDVDINIDASVKWEHPTAFFFDAITLEVVDEPGDPVMKDWQVELWDASLELQTIELNRKAALQDAIFADGFVPVTSEFWKTPSDWVERAAQGAESHDARARRVYYAEVPNWTDVKWFTEPEPVGVTIDVSHWQGKMDWAKAKAAGVTHAYMKATQGNDFEDPQFKRNWTEAKAHGILRGAYCYYVNNISPDSQAAHFLEVLAGDYGELPLVLDVEDTNSSPNSDEILEWLSLVEDDAGHEVAIYTSPGYWDTHFPEHLDWPKDYKLWVAHWTDAYEPDIPEDWNDWWLWQYMNNADGYLYGASSPHIDLDSFNA